MDCEDTALYDEIMGRKGLGGDHPREALVLASKARALLHGRFAATREEFDAVRAMAQKAREENEALKARLDEAGQGRVGWLAPA